MSDVTHILEAIKQDDTQATDQLLPLVYEELRRLAAQKWYHEPAGHTLEATALVHEEELYDNAADPHGWKNLAHDPRYADVKETLKKWLVVQRWFAVPGNGGVI